MNSIRPLHLLGSALLATVVFTATVARAATPSPSRHDGKAGHSTVALVANPAGVSQSIGRRPIAAFGNTRGSHDVRPGAFPPTLNVPAKAADRIVVSMVDESRQILPAQSPVTAIDILLEPDATMLQRAEANNARLLKAYPKGFALDALHRPHITLIQRFVRTADLDQMYSAVEKVLAGVDVNGMKLEAFKFYYAPSGALGVAGISAKPTPEIIQLQADVIAAVEPFTVETGPIGAFTAAHDDPAIDAGLIAYVSTFVPKMTGENFNPHVSTGVAPREHLDRMLAEPFEQFTFSPAGAAVYQLGPFGSAARKLKAWDLQR